MPKVRLTVPVTDNEGKPHAQGEVVDVDDEVATEWRNAGKASLVEDEERNAKAAAEGHYSDVTGRDDVGALGGSGTQPGPQTDDEPPKRKK